MQICACIYSIFLYLLNEMKVSNILFLIKHSSLFHKGSNFKLLGLHCLPVIDFCYLVLGDTKGHYLLYQNSFDDDH